jgi:hypothetical protein
MKADLTRTKKRECEDTDEENLANESLTDEKD